MTESLYNISGFIFVAGVIWGIKLMSSPKTAEKGIFLSSICTLGAIVTTLLYNEIITVFHLWPPVVIAVATGYILAVKVTMIQMPQFVALLNGIGGGSSALVSLVVILDHFPTMSLFNQSAAALGYIAGWITLSGSLVAAAKLDRKLKQEPLVLKRHTALSMLLLVSSVIAAVLLLTGPESLTRCLLFIAGGTAFCFGILFTLRIGGADMPITISLLNSLSGIAAAIAGLALRDFLLVAVGGVVGASGFVLTQLMCSAMNKKIWSILTGKTRLLSAGAGESVSPVRERDADDLAGIIRKAQKVVIVPGYGMAVAQAQEKVKDLSEALLEAGKEVKFAIHPVAGRMPGHMNVLLAEVDIDYERLFEMEEINPELSETDLVIVIGANDVVNPAANTAEGTPIYGMPVLEVEKAGHIIICNKDTKPGYSGVDNPLYTRENVTLLLGDAAETVVRLTALLK